MHDEIYYYLILIYFTPSTPLHCRVSMAFSLPCPSQMFLWKNEIYAVDKLAYKKDLQRSLQNSLSAKLNNIILQSELWSQKINNPSLGFYDAKLQTERRKSMKKEWRLVIAWNCSIWNYIFVEENFIIEILKLKIGVFKIQILLEISYGWRGIHGVKYGFVDKINY